MRTRMKGGRITAVAAALLLAVGVLVAPGPAEPAAAQSGCAPNANAIPTWATLYDDRGVTLCRGDGPAPLHDLRAFVQIVDIDAGAEVVVRSDRENDGESASNSNQYNKMTADDWFDFIVTNDGERPGRLFSTANASFFVDTVSPTTALSLPERARQMPFPITAHTLGHVQVTPLDEAYHAEKKVFRTRGLTGAPVTPQAEIQPFPTYYTNGDVNTAFGIGTTPWLGAVGLGPLEGSGVSLRNMVGWDGSRVYILHTVNAYTLAEAQDILRSFGSIEEIQFDGGGSSQLHYEADGIGEGGFVSLISRTVPDVFGVYLAPE